MTFTERFAALYSRREKPVSRKRIRAAIREIAADANKPDLHDAWIEYRDRRLEARHAR